MPVSGSVRGGEEIKEETDYLSFTSELTSTIGGHTPPPLSKQMNLAKRPSCTGSTESFFFKVSSFYLPATAEKNLASC